MWLPLSTFSRRHLACTRKDNIDIVHLLLQAGADIDAPLNADGKSPRDLARASGLDLGTILPCALVERAFCVLF